MHKHSLMCPIYFDPMFVNDDGSAITEEQWSSYSLSDVILRVTYELFYDMTGGKDYLLDAIEELDKEAKAMLTKILEPVQDREYLATWKGIGKDQLKPRVLIYPSGHRSSRLRLSETYQNETEIIFLLKSLKQVGITCTRNHDATIEIRAAIGGKLAHLKPCCPHCNTILPDKWFNSVGYHKVALLAPPVGGKTTLLASWMIHNYAAIRSMGFSNGCSAVYGLETSDREFEIQSYFRRAADELFKNGTYPGRDEANRKPPVYTRIIHYLEETNPDTELQEEYLLVGTYDIAGETLIKSDTNEISTELTEYLSHMDAFIYMINPSQMNGLSKVFVKNGSKETLEVPEGESLRVLSLKEQAAYQKEHQLAVVSGEAILRSGSQEESAVAPWEIFHKVDSMLISKGIKNRAHMAYTICMCDELAQLPEIRETVDAQVLFTNPKNDHLLDKRYILQNAVEVKKLIGRFAVDQENPEFIKMLSNTDSVRGGFRSVSWHCVSAGPKRDAGEAYSSIRKIDPLIGCLESEFARLGWTKDEA